MTGVPHPAIVLADLLCAAADDLELPITRQLADAVAARMAELLALAGHELVHREDR